MPIVLDFEFMQSTLMSDLGLVSALQSGTISEEVHDRPDYEHIIICIFFIISTISIAIRTFFHHNKKNLNIQASKADLISYQATNMLVNLFLGLFGLYSYNFCLPDMSTLLITHRIVGFHQFKTFACAQIGYNLWSLPVGYFIVGENTAMMGHHLATIAVSSISLYGRFCFGYHIPFFFGLIEISSVPLAIMNFCKGNPEIAKKYFPYLGAIVRPIFAVSFLTTRVCMWTPAIYDVLRSTVMLCWTCTSVVNQICLGLFFISVTFLTILQYYWGSLVVKGLLKVFQSVQVQKVNGDDCKKC